MAVVVRPFGPGDADACGAIVGATPLWQRAGLGAERAAAILTSAAAQGETVLVLDVDGTLEGFAWIDPRGAFGRSGYLRMIAVAPSRRSAGHGTRLMQAFEGVAATQGADAFLLVSDFNLDAQRLYRRLGYDEVGRVPDYIMPGVVELLYWKRVRPT
jgi:ribosomal protein S18 acetylase RimI-like enzyme